MATVVVVVDTTAVAVAVSANKGSVGGSVRHKSR